MSTQGAELTPCPGLQVKAASPPAQVFLCRFPRCLGVGAKLPTLASCELLSEALEA